MRHRDEWPIVAENYWPHIGRKLTVGDGNLGFWAALREVYPETQEQRCWKHKLANVLDKLPKRLQPRAKAMLHEIMYAPDRQTALEEIARFSQEYGARYPKAARTLSQDRDRLLTFFDFPAEHWIHLRTTNPIESTFSIVKARTKKTKGAGSRKAGLAMAFKLLLAAEKRWRRVNAPHLVALIRAGVEFPNGEAEMFRPEPAPEHPFTHTPPIFAARELSIHNI
jgi:putative transposase